MNTRTWLWSSFDFANSLASIAVSFYFSLWFVQDLRGDGAWISLTVALTTILLLIVLPRFGARSDRLGKRMPSLRITTMLCILSLALLGWIALGVEEPSRWTMLVLLVLYGLYQFFFQASLAFYTAFLHDVSAGRSEEGTSGFGFALGQIGNVVGLFALLPLTALGGRPVAFLAGAGLFLLCAIPTLVYLKDRPLESTPQGEVTPGFLMSIARLRKEPNVFRYLIAYYFFADAVLTLQLFVSLYLGVVGGLPDKTKTLALAGGVFAAAIGAWASTWLARRCGGTKRAISGLILIWTLCIIALALARSPLIFLIVTILNGAAFGALFSLSRAFFAKLIPQNAHAEYFGLYVLFERASSVIGPLLWSGTLVIFHSYGDDRYRFGMISLAVMVGISFLLLRRVKEPHTVEVVR